MAESRERLRDSAFVIVTFLMLYGRLWRPGKNLEHNFNSCFRSIIYTLCDVP